jgi:hypothetical protein
MRSYTCIIAAVFSLLVFEKQALSQSRLADTTKLEKRISILNNKVSFDFPAKAMNTPRVADIMAADPNINRETRIIYDQGKMRLVFFAQELFALSGPNMLADLSKEVEPDFDFQRKTLTDADSLLTVLSTPSLFDTASNAILVNSLMVKNPDNTVFRIDAYISPDAFLLKDEYTRLTEKVFATITKGTRRINLGAKEETYKIAGTTSSLNFKLPKGYFITIDEKYDFSVYKITKYKDLTDKSFASITLYTGYHPSFFYKEYDYTDSNAVKLKGQFAQKPMEWLFFKDDAQSFYLKEQMMPSDYIDTGMILHVAMLCNKKELMDELVKITEAIRITK